MIKIEIYRNYKKQIVKVKVLDHGNSIICSAVSALVINTVNSLEILTEVDFSFDYEEEGGYLVINMTDFLNGNSNKNAELLLDSLALGVHGIYENYKDNEEFKNQISIIEKEE